MPETQLRIKETAHNLIMKYSVRSVSMDDIAAKLGISKKTIYQYYKDKDELVEAVIVDVLRINENECKLSRKKSDNAIHEVFLSMDMILEMFKDMNPTVLFDLQKYHPTAFHHFLKHKNEFVYNVIKSNIQRGKNEGLYRSEIDDEIIARFRVEAIMMIFNPDFVKSTRADFSYLNRELELTFLFGMVTPKGYKLIVKYLNQREKLNK